MEKMIAWIIGHLPKPLQKLWYAHESVWMYILVGGLTVRACFSGRSPIPL